jgi:Holliday junction resolvasome RuvABC ATP-dependent DNA helicase subunit
MTDAKAISDQNLRPSSLADYIGQDQVVKTLRLFLDAAKKRGKASEHILFYGPPGIGKTTQEVQGSTPKQEFQEITDCLCSRFYGS